MTYKIERVPLPSKMKAKPEREEIYATAAILEVGESFVFPKEFWFTSIGQCIERGRGKGKKFTVRKDEKGYRIFRTE